MYWLIFITQFWRQADATTELHLLNFFWCDLFAKIEILKLLINSKKYKQIRKIHLTIWQTLVNYFYKFGSKKWSMVYYETLFWLQKLWICFSSGSFMSSLFNIELLKKTFCLVKFFAQFTFSVMFINLSIFKFPLFFFKEILSSDLYFQGKKICVFKIA